METTRYRFPKMRAAIGAACIRVARALNPNARIIVASVQRGGRKRSGAQRSIDVPVVRGEAGAVRVACRNAGLYGRPAIVRPRGVE
jgi:hypothetical protein